MALAKPEKQFKAKSPQPPFKKGESSLLPFTKLIVIHIFSAGHRGSRTMFAVMASKRRKDNHETHEKHEKTVLIPLLFNQTVSHFLAGWLLIQPLF